MQAFLSHLASQNYNITAPVLDGKMHRFDRDGKQNAWYIGWQNHSVRTGKTYIVAQYGDWRTNEAHTYKPGGLSREDGDAIKKQIEEGKRQAAIEKEVRNEETSMKAIDAWPTLAVTGTSEYVTRKKLLGLYGARMFGNVIAVPCMDVDGKLWGLQKIYPNGDKRFSSGQKVDGCFHRIPGVVGEPYRDVFLCEGFATGASIHMATGKEVFCAFNAKNLIAVAKALHLRYQDINITICADDDRHNAENVGLDCANKAATICNGAVKAPVFSSNQGTDFNDLHCQEGIDKVKDQLYVAPEPTTGYIHLGYDEGTYFFYSIEARDVFKVTAFTSVQLYMIAPAEYWMGAFPSKMGVAWESAKDHLVQTSKRCGQFDVNRIRGSGVWTDEGRVIVNTGNTLMCDGKATSLAALKSRYIYTRTKKSIAPVHAKPLNKDETKTLVDACTMLNWQESKSGYLLAGWIAVARICSALPVRPHCWLTGGSGTGKSTVMEKILYNTLASGKLYVQGGSTEAGIRQALKGSSFALLFDEFETNNEANKLRVNGITEMLRQSWSDTHGVVLKGTASGNGETYALNSPAFVASIRVNLDNDADRSRFSIIELLPHKNDTEHWHRLNTLLKQIDLEYGERLFSRMVRMVPVVLKNYHTIGHALSLRMGKRYGQQTGMILAGYWALLNDDPIRPEVAEMLVKELDLDSDREEADNTDEIECLNHLMTTKVTTRDSNNFTSIDTTIGKVLQDSVNDMEIRLLETYGVYLIKEKNAVFISTNHAELAKIYSRTRWTNWTKSFLRLPGAKKHQLAPGQNKSRPRGVLIPMEKI